MSDPRVIHVVIDEPEKHDRNDTCLGQVIEGIVDFVESCRGGNEDEKPHSIWANKEDDTGNYTGE